MLTTQLGCMPRALNRFTQYFLFLFMLFVYCLYNRTCTLIGKTKFFCLKPCAVAFSIDQYSALRASKFLFLKISSIDTTACHVMSCHAKVKSRMPSDELQAGRKEVLMTVFRWSSRMLSPVPTTALGSCSLCRSLQLMRPISGTVVPLHLAVPVRKWLSQGPVYHAVAHNRKRRIKNTCQHVHVHVYYFVCVG